MRRTIAFILLALFGAASMVPARADDRADLYQMATAFRAVKSVHVDIHNPDGRTMAVDIIMPNKFHTSMPTGMEVIAIGSDVWMKHGDSWMKVPGIMGSRMNLGFDQARTAGISGDPRKDYTITNLGPAMMGTIATHHYRLVKNGDSHPLEMWIGNDHLPVQIQVQNSQGTSTIDYSNYNGVPDITPPV